jgi:hypothetical protein
MVTLAANKKSLKNTINCELGPTYFCFDDSSEGFILPKNKFAQICQIWRKGILKLQDLGNRFEHVTKI